jgi:hypothetical protein
LKLNYIGIVGAILAFVSIALAWWTMAITTPAGNEDISIWTYQARITAPGVSYDLVSPPTGITPLNIWFSYAALALVIIGGVLAIVGSVTALGRKLLIGGGVLTLLSLIIFAVGLYNTLSAGPLVNSSFPQVGLFSSGTYSGASYSTYLTYGFWVALVAMILMFVAIVIKPKEQVTQPPPATPPAQT